MNIGFGCSRNEPVVGIVLLGNNQKFVGISIRVLLSPLPSSPDFPLFEFPLLPPRRDKFISGYEFVFAFSSYGFCLERGEVRWYRWYAHCLDGDLSGYRIGSTYHSPPFSPTYGVHRGTSLILALDPNFSYFSFVVRRYSTSIFN